MKKIVITALVVVSAFLNAADDRKESELMGMARAAIASNDQDRMNEQLYLIASCLDGEATQAMQILLDAGAGWIDKRGRSVLQNLVRRKVPASNLRVLREWSEANEDAIDPNYCQKNHIHMPPLIEVCVDGGTSSSFSPNPAMLEELLQFKKIDVNLIDSKGRTPLSGALKVILHVNHLLWGDCLFEMYLSYIDLLVQHGAHVTEELLLRVDTALEDQTIDQDQYGHIMGVLVSGRSTKSASSKG